MIREVSKGISTLSEEPIKEYVPIRNSMKNQQTLENTTLKQIGNCPNYSIGKELLSICDYKQVDGFIEYLKQEWKWSRTMGDQWRVEGDKIIRT